MRLAGPTTAEITNQGARWVSTVEAYSDDAGTFTVADETRNSTPNIPAHLLGTGETVTIDLPPDTAASPILSGRKRHVGDARPKFDLASMQPS